MPTWFLPPDFTFAADGPIQLGTVIPHPSKPTLVLASCAITLPRISTLTETNHVCDTSNARSNGFSSWLQVIGLASASTKTNFGKSALLSFGTVDHEIRTFAEPLTPDAVLRIVALPAVQQHMDSGLFGSRPVYIVSGVRIAKTPFTVKRETGASSTMEVSGSGPPMPGTLELGASVEHHRKKIVENSYETAPGIIFAYRLHVIRQKRAGVESKLFQNKAAFMTGTGRVTVTEPLIVVEGTKG